MKPSEWLDELDSHGIYPESVLLDLDEEYREHVPTYSHARTANAIKARGLGGQLAPDTGDRLVYGYSAASGLANALLENAPGNRYGGRGSAFRADVAGLKEAGL